MKCVRTWTNLFAAVSVTWLLVSCGQAPTAPTPPSPSGSALLPQPSPSGPTLRGVVFQRTGQGRRPIAGARVFVVDLVEGPYGNFPWFELASDMNGGFSLTNALDGREVKITAFLGPGGGLWNESGLSQVCAVHSTAGLGATVEIELVERGVPPGKLNSPVLSGVVFENTGDGSRPAADMAVLYSSNNHDGADVYMRTDAEGRYRFCGIPLGAGYLLPACPRGTLPPPNYRPTTFPVDVRGDTILNAFCP